MIAENQQPLQQARQALGRLEYDFSEEVSHAKRKLYRQREELEIKYRKLNAQRKVNEGGCSWSYWRNYGKNTKRICKSNSAVSRFIAVTTTE